jgi:hypothetical protein
MSGTVPPPPPPGPAPQEPGAERSQEPRQAPPSFAPAGARPWSAASPASPAAAPTAATPAPAADPQATQVHHGVHAPVPPAPSSSAPGAGQATAAFSPRSAPGTYPAQPTAAYPPQGAYAPQPTAAQPTAAQPPVAQPTAAYPPAPPAAQRATAPARQPAYSQPAPAPGYGYAPQQHAYAASPAPAPQAPRAAPGPATTQNPAVGRSSRRRLSPGWIAFIAVDVVLAVVALVFVVQALGGSDVPTVSTPSDTPAAVQQDDAAAEEEAAGGFGAQVAELRSPSRNISCQIFEAGVSCGIAELNQRPAPVEGCDGSSGYVVALDAAGDVALPCVAEKPKKAPKKLDELAYGESVTEGDFTCTSEQDGMYCRHDPTGNGFSLARAGIGASS